MPEHETPSREELLEALARTPWSTEGGDLRDGDGTDIGVMWDPAHSALAALAVEMVSSLLEKDPRALEAPLSVDQTPSPMPGRTAHAPQAIEDRIEHVSVYSVYPQGLTDLTDINAHSFEVQVRWRGEHQGRSGGGWSVSRGPMDLLTSSATDTPQWDMPERFRRWQYRFTEFEDALAAARAVVDAVKINGRTWAQWQEHAQQDDTTPKEGTP